MLRSLFTVKNYLSTDPSSAHKANTSKIHFRRHSLREVQECSHSTNRCSLLALSQPRLLQVPLLLILDAPTVGVTAREAQADALVAVHADFSVATTTTTITPGLILSV
jgi:hypothetical protein